LPELLIAAGLILPLALDTFAVAAALSVAGLAPRDRNRVAVIFTAFEAGMPVAGLLIGQAAGRLIGEWAAYVAVALLVIAGVLLIRGGADEEAEERRLRLLAQARGLAIIGLGVSISIDELTIGLSAGLIGLPIVLAIIWIAVQAFVAAQLGLRLGAMLSERVRERAERLAGVALIAVAAALLVLILLGR
jgi:putative Mn2+ efflux pump MntP